MKRGKDVWGYIPSSGAGPRLETFCTIKSHRYDREGNPNSKFAHGSTLTTRIILSTVDSGTEREERTCDHEPVKQKALHRDRIYNGLNLK